MKQLLNKLLQRYHSNDSNLIGVMEEVIESFADDKRRWDYMPYHGLPDVSSVRMEVKPWSMLFALFGIKKRTGAATMYYIRYKNGKLNRYLLGTIRRLKKHKNSDKFGPIANHILKRSKIFFLVALKHVVPRGHRDLPFGFVLRLYNEYRQIAASQSGNIDYKRVYIEKANGKLRGLGVPKLVGRVYLHQLNQLLVLKFNEKIQPSQHGFRPMQGTLTAGLDLLKNIHNGDNIYEFDYQGFFPNLDIFGINKVLRAYEVHESGVTKIDRLNRSLPKLQKVDRMDESAVHDQRAYEKDLKRAIDIVGFNPLTSTKFIPMDVLYDVLQPKRHPLIGIPQGAPTSPFLSILTLDGVVRKDAFVYDVRYADDGLRMTNGKPVVPTESEDMIAMNIKYAPEKCGGVKSEGKGLKELKFLGLVYNFERDELRAETRKGSKLIYDKQSLTDIIYDGEFKRRPDYPEGNLHGGESFIHSSLSGFILSRLYTGSGNLDNYVQSFKLTSSKDSGVQSYNKFIKRGSKKNKLLKDLMHIKLNVFNSSSLCLQTALEALKEVSRKPPVKTKLIKRSNDTSRG